MRLVLASWLSFDELESLSCAGRFAIEENDPWRSTESSGYLLDFISFGVCSACSAAKKRKLKEIQKRKLAEAHYLLNECKVPLKTVAVRL